MITIKNIQRICLVVALLSTSMIFAAKRSSLASEATNNTLTTVLLQTTPPAPIIVNQTCSSAELQNTGTIPSGEMWYWQTTKHGTDTTYPATSNYTANGSGTYRLRPLHLGTNTWGVGSSVIVTLDPNAGSTWYLDADGDGLGDPNHTIFQCLQPFGYVSNGNDLCPDVAGSSNDGGCAAEDPDNQNYIYTITAKVATTDIDTLKGTANGIENVTYFDGLGRPKQSVAIRAGGVLTDKNTLLYDWSLGNTGSTPFYTQEGTNDENTIVRGTTPFGHNDLLWECKDTNGGGGAGWITDPIAIDKTKAYRYTVWVKRTHSNDGNTLFGTHVVAGLDGTNYGEKYFFQGDLPELDTWYLLVGIIHPHDYSSGDQGISGVYDMQGNKVLDAEEYKWQSTSTEGRFRSYLFTDNASDRQYLWSPLVQKIDGTELSLPEVLSTSSVVPNQETTADIVTHIEYDSYGRQLREYLPFAVYSNDGAYRTGDMALVTQNYYKHKHPTDFTNSIIADVNAYSEKTLENSPLGRVFEQTAPGEAWKQGANTITGKGYSDGHSIRFEYDVNHATEVRKYTVSLSFANNTYTPTLIGGTTHYPIGELTKTITKDENWVVADGLKHTTEEFKDKNGRVLLKRTYAEVGSPSVVEGHDTYYVYDDYGNLTYVLPPKVDTSDGISASELADLSYQYKYDHRNRLVEKKIPGKGWEFIIYDKLDRPVMTQDAIQASNNEWLITKYDVLGRVVYTAKYDHGSTSTREAMQSSFSSQNDATFDQYETKVSSGTGVDNSYYTNNNFPTSNVELLTVNYYDNYTFDLAGAVAPTDVYGVAPTTNTVGLATGSKVKVLGTSNWTTNITYYDVKARPVYVYSNNVYLGTTDIVESKLDDFTGKVLETKTTHQKTGKSDIVTIDGFEYDHTDRLISQTQRINNQSPERLVQNHYDELGQLESKLVGNGTSKGYRDVTSGITINGNEIKKTTSGSWDTGLATIGAIAGDGYISFTANQTHGFYYMVGLSSSNTDAHFSSIEYAIYMSTGTVVVFESGSNMGSFGSYQEGDKFDIERKGDTIYYKWNGSVFYTSQKVSTGSLLGDISIFSTNTLVKDLHLVDNKEGLQKVDYTYNVRGWLKNINNDTYNDNDLFNFNLRYNDPTSGTALYNGNISQTSWNTLNTDTSTKTYTYTYDALNRITSGIDDTGNYNLTSVSYDKNGNILNLQRKGHTNPGATTFGVMDDLGYTYDTDSNQLLAVSDSSGVKEGFNDKNGSGNDYTYDVNGNMTVDNNKNITSIAYNHLNLPTKVVFNNNDPLFSQNPEAIEYVYDAAGMKLKKTVKNGSMSTTITDYAGNYIYENDDLQFFNHAEGYVKKDGNDFEYVYQYTDIWKNVRLSYSDTDGNGTISQSEIIEESNFYPFGLKHQGYNNVVTSNGNSIGQKEKTYQGQRYTDDLGLNVHEWKYRVSDPTTGRFWQVDPLAEDYTYNSTYAFAENKLGMGIELEGAEIYTWLQQKAAEQVVNNPNGVVAHGVGLVQGLVNGGKGVVDMVSNPGQTFESMLQLASPYPNQTQANFGDGLINDFNAVVSGDGIERGEVLGRGAFDALLAKGVGKLGKLGKTSGSATITKFDGTLDNPFGHYTIETNFKGNTLSTEQIITSGDLSTTTISKTIKSSGGKTAKVKLPDAKSAQSYQRSQIGKQTGAYNKMSNSCVSHCGNVLRSGGVGVPTSPLSQFKFIKTLFDKNP